MYVPDVEYFFDVPYKFYCGKCERLIAVFSGGCDSSDINYVVEEMKDETENCPWCGARIFWEGLIHE